ncbi:MAG: nucleoside-diphosphate sugar epimerase/dehydratase [Bacteroidales bacterium]|jgi:FlaA1/EpsC-like NDP-sugar epimerase|nr:nucleoside-diphosphate sugar epimerase/dehydratase [Bacteroidales bacterium]MDY0159978.1 nucleoside-diphosphate sugar epimerase/dehydratase [Bacteroidales bacterium]
MNINVLRSITPRWVVFLIDISICLFSIVFAYYLRFNFDVPTKELQSFSYVIPIVLFVRSLSFIIARTYAGMVRHTSTRDIQRLILVTSISSAVLMALNILNLKIQGRYLIPMSVIIIDYLTISFALSFSRLLVKTIYLEANNPRKNSTLVGIYGTGELALITKKTLDRDTESRNRVAAFFDHSTKITGNKIEGINVYEIDALQEIINKLEISTFIIAQKGLPVKTKQHILDVCLEAKVQVKTVPEISTWINGELSLKQIKDFKIEDLLQRAEIKMDTNKIRKNIIGKTVLVTGAAGSIGSEIVRQLLNFKPDKIILFDYAESNLYELELELSESLNFHRSEIIIGDIRNKLIVEKVFKKHTPQLVFHAAAYKHVPMMEHHPAEAIRTNVLGTKTLADIAVEYNVEKFVMISTDKAVNPTNVMGASKRIAEMYVQSLNNIYNTQFITTRFGNVLGSSGSVIPRFKKQIDKGGPVTVTHPEVTRFFMTIPEACQLVLEAGIMGEGGEIFIFDMGEPIKIVRLAQRMIELSGLKVGEDIQIKFTGLRPGEKLYEELLASKENTIPTYHKQIMIAKVIACKYDKINSNLTKLHQLINFSDNFEIVKEMKIIIPEFISQNSIYETLD